MADAINPATATPIAPTANPGGGDVKSFAALWQRAEAAADETGGDPAPGHDDPEKAAPAPAAKPAAEAKGDAERDESGKFKRRERQEKKPEPAAEETDRNEGKVSVAERVRFREERRQMRAKLEAEHAQRLAQVEQLRSEFGTKFSKYQAAEEALERGDFDGFAKALGRGNSWNDLEKEAIARLTDPNYKRMRDLERKEHEREQQQREAQQRWQQQQAEQRQQQEISGYKSEMVSQMQTSGIPALRELHDDDAFVHALFEVQRAYFDGNETITLEEALETPFFKGRDGKALSVLDIARNSYSKWDKVFRGAPRPEADEASTRTAQQSVRQGKQPKRSPPHKHATETAAPAKRSPEEWKRFWTDQLRSSTSED